MAENAGGTETHAAWGAGNPHLIVSSEDGRFTFSLEQQEVTIGSAAGNALTLPDTDAVHATIVHDDRDEYVLTLHGEGEMNANPHAEGTHEGDRSETLRTGASFTAGPWRFVFQREEFADHGRPFGGRQGGEYSDQPPQPRRPDYTQDRSGSDRPPGVEVDEH